MPRRRTPGDDDELCHAKEAWASEFLSAWPQCALARETLPKLGPSLSIAGVRRLDLDVKALPGGPAREDAPRGPLPRLIVCYVQIWLATHPGVDVVPLGDALMAWIENVVGLEVPSQRALAGEITRLSQCGWSMSLASPVLSDQLVRLDFAAPGSESACFAALRAGKVPDEIRISSHFAALARRNRAVFQEARLGEIADDSLALDVYAWIPFWVVRRRSFAKTPPMITAGWPLLISIFGLEGTDSDGALKRRLTTAFQRACQAWGGVFCEVCSRGVTLLVTPGFAHATKSSWPGGEG